MGKFMSLYVSIFGAFVTLAFPIFMAGMIEGSLSSGHIQTAALILGVLILFWPLLLAATINGCRSTYEMHFKNTSPPGKTS
jgi:hypothetical protein